MTKSFFDIFLTLYYIPFTLFSLLILIIAVLASSDTFFNKYLKNLVLLSFLIFTLLTFYIGIIFDTNLYDFQFVFSFGNFLKGISFRMGIDGISYLFIFLTVFIVTLCLFFNWDNILLNSRYYCAALILTTFFLVLAFSCLDIFLFYFFFESVVIPVFLLIGIWGSRIRRIYASYAFILYTLFGSLLMFLGILYLIDRIGSTDYTILLNSAFFKGFTKIEQKYLWVAFFITFAAKIPMVPLHIWLPEAHVEAPTTGSVILASILLKLGVYGFLRYSLVFFPWACFFYIPVIFTLSCLGIVYGSLTALRQVDFKRIIAYASIAHMNMIILGIFCDHSIGIEGAIIQSLSHGFVSSGLFFLIGMLYERYHTRIIHYYKGMVYIMPIYTTFFFFFSLANIGMPLTANFIGEFLILNGLVGTNFFIAIISCFGMIIGAAYSLRLYNKIAFGNITQNLIRNNIDLYKKEIIILLLLSIFVLFIGIFPRILTEYITEKCILFI